MRRTQSTPGSLVIPQDRGYGSGASAEKLSFHHEEAAMTTILHIENQVRDFESWKSVFDKFGNFRSERNVRGYRLGRGLEDPNRVTVDLEFDSVADAEAFGVALQKIWATPQSRDELVSHNVPVILELIEDHRI